MSNNFWNNFTQGFAFGMLSRTPFFGCWNFNMCFPSFGMFGGFTPFQITPLIPGGNIWDCVPQAPSYQSSSNWNFDFNFINNNSNNNLNSGFAFNAGFDTFTSSNPNWNSFTQFSPNWSNFNTLQTMPSKIESPVTTTKPSDVTRTSRVTVPTESQDISSYRQKIMNKAEQYVGMFSEDKDRSLAIRTFRSTPIRGGGWCVDFATYCVKSAMPNYPKNMVTSGTDDLIGKAEKRNCYLTAPSTNKGDWALKNIKPGDIVMTGGNGDSRKHAVIAKEVLVKNGKVVIRCYSGNDKGVRIVDWPVERGRHSTKHGGWYMPVYGVVKVDKFA